MNGIINGFDIINQDVTLNAVCVQNHRSALKPGVKELMDTIIREELAEGNYVITETPPIIISALGAVPKSDGGIRPIHDCSLPAEAGLNSYAPDLDHCKYQSVDDAVSLLKQGHYAAKIDLSHAYRSVPISKSSQRATGLQWTFENGQRVVMYDTKLPFGSSASPTVFHRLSQAVRRMMAR